MGEFLPGGGGTGVNNYFSSSGYCGNNFGIIDPLYFVIIPLGF